MNQVSMQLTKVVDRGFADKHKPMGMQKSDAAELRKLQTKKPAK